MNIYIQKYRYIEIYVEMNVEIQKQFNLKFMDMYA